MPTIPIQKNQISTDVPGFSINPAGYGAVEEATGKLGQRVTEVSFQLAEQIKHSEAVDSSETIFNNRRLQSESLLASLKLENPDGYMKGPDGTRVTNPDGTHVGITQAYKETVDKWYREDQDAMPSDLAQQMYRSKAGTFFTSQAASAFNEEQVLKIQHQAINQQNRDQTRANSLVSYSSPTKVYELANESAKDILENTGPGKLYNMNIAREKILRNEEQFAESAGKFALNQALATPDPSAPPGTRQRNIDEWITVLNESPAAGPLTEQAMSRKANGLKLISEMFNPDKKAEILHSLMAARKQANSYDKASYEAKFKELNAQIENGDFVNPSHVSGLMDEARQLRAVGVETPIGLAQKIATLSATKSLADTSSGLWFLPPEVISSTLDMTAHTAWLSAQAQLSADPESNSSMIGSDAKKHIREKMRTIETAKAKAASDDWASFVETGDETSKARRAQIDRDTIFSNPNSLAGKGRLLQDQIKTNLTMGSVKFPNNPEFVRVISKDDSTNIGKYFTGSAASEEEKTQAILTIRKEYGPYFQEVMHQMIEDKNLPQKFKFVTMLSGSETQTKDILSGIISDKSKSKDWEVFSANNDEFSETKMKAALGEEFKRFITVKAQENPGDPLARMNRDVIIEAAMGKAVDNVLSGRASTSAEAAKQAYQALVDRNGDLVEYQSPGIFGTSFFGGQKRNVWLPKQIGSMLVSDKDRQAVSGFWQENLTVDGLKKLGVVPPPLPGGAAPSQEVQDLFYKQLANTDKAGARVVYNEKLKGFEIFYQDRYYNSDRLALTVGPDGRRKALLIPVEKVFGHTVGQPLSVNRTFIPGQNSSTLDFFKSANAATQSPVSVPVESQIPLNDNVFFKEQHMAGQLDSTDPRVRYIMNDIGAEFLKLGEKAMITRVTDKWNGDTGIHKDGRAIDISTKDMSKEQIEKIVSKINQSYPRNDNRPTAIHHKVKGGAYHLHVQVPIK